jgi:hypothetical protein
MGSPAASVRADIREAFNSISASRPCASASCSAIEVNTRPMRSVVAELRRQPTVDALSVGLLRHGVLHADETRMAMLRRPGAGG